MKVLHLIETLGVGGAEASLLEILSRLESARPIMCHIYDGDAMRSAYEAAGIPVVSLRVPPKYHFATALRRVGELVRAENPDLIHTTLFRADVVGRIVGRRMRIPVVGSFVSECYAPIRWRMLSPFGRTKLRGVQVIDRLTAPLAFHYVANSETVRRSECRSLGIPPARVSVIHRGRDPSRFSVVLSPARLRARKESLGVTLGTSVVLSVGRLVASKGHIDLIAAFERVVQKVPDVVLLLAGDGPERGGIERRAKEADLERKIRFLGLRDDIPELLALADVFAFPSHYEGHPGALVEAMVAGKAIVVSDTPIHRETTQNGHCGLLVPVGNADAMANGLLKLLRDQPFAAKLGERARESGRRRFDVSRIAAQYDEFYQKVLRAYARGTLTAADRCLQLLDPGDDSLGSSAVAGSQ